MAKPTASENITLGAITIGQSPRDDMVPEIEEVLGNGFELVQAGALDDYTYEQIVNHFSPADKDDVLVSRLRDGREVFFAEKHIIPLLQNCIDKLADKGIDTILMLCTGKFPEWSYPGLIITPQTVLHKMVAGLIGERVLGVIAPDEKQIDQVTAWWRANGVTAQVKAASPYQSLDEIGLKAKQFSNSEAELIFLDCMGFTREMQSLVAENSGKKVILPRTMIAAIIKELLS